GLGETRARRFLVDVPWFQLEEMQLFPGQREKLGGRLGVEDLPLLHGDLAVGAAYVVADHAALERGRGRSLPSLRDGLHLSPRLPFSLIGLPVPPRWTARISASTARAISGADCAPRSRPMGTCTRLRASSAPPSPRSRSRMPLPRRLEPSSPT